MVEMGEWSDRLFGCERNDVDKHAEELIWKSGIKKKPGSEGEYGYR